MGFVLAHAFIICFIANSTEESVQCVFVLQPLAIRGSVRGGEPAVKSLIPGIDLWFL